MANTDDINARKYAMLLSYLGNESTIFWQRFYIFLLANTALFGFSWNNPPLFSPCTPVERAIISALAGIAGLCLCWLWARSLDAGEFWIDHWTSILKDLERKVWDEIKLLREFEPKPDAPKRIRAKVVARQAVGLFAIIWILTFLYGLSVFFFLLCHCR